VKKRRDRKHYRVRTKKGKWWDAKGGIKGGIR